MWDVYCLVVERFPNLRCECCRFLQVVLFIFVLNSVYFLCCMKKKYAKIG